MVDIEGKEKIEASYFTSPRAWSGLYILSVKQHISKQLAISIDGGAKMKDKNKCIALVQDKNHLLASVRSVAIGSSLPLSS